MPAAIAITPRPITITRMRKRWLEQLAAHGWRSWSELRESGDVRSASVRIWRPMLDEGLIEIMHTSSVPVPLFRITAKGREALELARQSP